MPLERTWPSRSAIASAAPAGHGVDQAPLRIRRAPHDRPQSWRGVGELSRRLFRREVRLGHSLEARPVQFPGGSEWHLVEDDYFLGRLVADPGARELDQLLAGGPLRPLGEGDVGADVLTVDKIVDPDHPSARDARMREQGVFDLLGAMFEASWTMICFLRPRKKK